MKAEAGERFLGRGWRSAVSSPSGVCGGVPETKRFCSILTAIDGLLWYLNLVATGVGLLLIPVVCFIVVWEVSDTCILIVDNGNELHYCSQTQQELNSC